MITYVVFDTLSNFSKIGKTKDIKSRLSTLRTSNLNLELLIVLDGDHEKMLHKLYYKKKVEKEWYRLNNKDLEDIIELKHEIFKNGL